MASPIEPRPEFSSTYFVQDRSNQDERARLAIQDRLMTESMGGVLPEQPDPIRFERVLDVGCGTGGWLIEAAKKYPGMSLLIGVDISGIMIEYARAQAKAQQVDDRVEFHTMDSLRMLEFPSSFFDLVNHRFAEGYLRTWDWPKLLQEYKRVSRPGGVIRITESDVLAESSSQALKRLNQLLLQTLSQAGHFFTPEPNGVTCQLADLLQRHGVQHVQTRALAIEYHAGTIQQQNFAEDMKHLFRTALPFFRKWIRVPENYEEIYQQMLSEIQQPDFVATWRLTTAWGNAPD